MRTYIIWGSSFYLTNISKVFIRCLSGFWNFRSISSLNPKNNTLKYTRREPSHGEGNVPEMTEVVSGSAGVRTVNLAAVSHFLTLILSRLAPSKPASPGDLAASLPSPENWRQQSEHLFFPPFKPLPAQSSEVLSPRRPHCVLRSGSHRLETRWQSVCVFSWRLWEESTRRIILSVGRIQSLAVVGLRSQFICRWW